MDSGHAELTDIEDVYHHLAAIIADIIIINYYYILYMYNAEQFYTQSVFCWVSHKSLRAVMVNIYYMLYLQCLKSNFTNPCYKTIINSDGPFNDKFD